MNAINNIAYWIATWFKVGLWPKMPGTWGSLMSIPIGALLYMLFGLNGLVAVTVVGLILGTIATYFVLYSTLDPDPSFVVIDEVVGQWFVFWAVGNDIRFWLMGFILFRLFDIIKPCPIKDVEIYFANGSQFYKAIGIMVDDLIAGGYAIICVWMLKIMFT